MNGAKGVAPVMPNSLEGRVSIRGAAKTSRELPRLLFVRSGSQDEDNFLVLPVIERRRDLNGGARIQRRANSAGKPNATHCRGVRQCAVAAKEFGAVSRDGS